ncbi:MULTISPECIES: hypothetical protein [Acinetobacter]|uniref:hypothetical protein n=1 Tax=Acinetobacter TaxID=469 RepID=UPI000761C226|nr:MULTISPECIES: hypothetical protein [Acinetobacter]AZB89903.1 hypothetical protein DKE41_001045 [Acinetobacter pittii]MBJ6353001.1 hypothetical protein [Acinetobacter sp. c1]MBM0958620.1 hypothetical protein [Acinetobacter sp. C13]ODL91682.1 hypothetical protein AXH23_14235 [Acinetobacter pittii]
MNNKLKTLTFSYSIKIPKESFPLIWKHWNDITNWSNWDKGLLETQSDGNKIKLGKNINILPYGTPDLVPICVTSFIDEQHFTTTSHTPIGSMSIGHSLIEKSAACPDDRIEHTICAQAHNYDFFKDNIWENLKQNIVQSVNNLVEITQKEMNQ